MSAFTIAAAQYPIDEVRSFAEWEDKLARWVAEAKAGGASLAVFPEYGIMELTAANAKARDDLAYSLAWLSDHRSDIDAAHERLAAEHHIHICAASCPTRMGDAFHNVARLFAPNRKMGEQAKIVMTRFEREIWGVSGGRELTLFDTALGKIGISICYDSEFPMIARALAEAGAKLLLVPSATDGLTGYWRVRVGAQARALENQFYAVHSPTVGEAPWCPSLDSNRGAAGIYGPPDLGFPDNGVVALGELDKPMWLFAEIDLAKVDAVRAEGAVFNHRHWTEQSDDALAGLPVVTQSLL
jgi:predicted amidohydrolase